MTAEMELLLTEPRPIEAAAPVVAHLLPGTGKRLVVVLSGVGRDCGAAPVVDFYGPAVADGENHVLFLSDTSRSWMNGPGVADEIVRLITAYRNAEGIEEIVTLGHSMGGFAALVLADLLPVATAIAFAPQFSMDPEKVPGETRWPFAAGMAAGRFGDVGKLSADGTCYFIFHGDNPWEARHWLRFPWNADGAVHHYILVGQAHSVAPMLNKRRMLGRVVETAMAQKVRGVRRALEKTFLGRTLIVQRRAQYQADHPDLRLEGGAPVVVPEVEEGGA